MKKFNKGLIVAICVLVFFTFVVITQADNQEEKYKKWNEELKQQGATFTVGPTSVSDKPIKEVASMKEPPGWRKNGKFDGIVGETLGLPTSFDWRTSNKVTPIKNQGSCGSCWAFGAIASYEAAIAVNIGPLEDLSEQWVLDCNSYGYDCNGGWWVFSDFTNGVPKESCYPYVAYQQSCNSGCTKYYPMTAWYYVGTSSGVPSTDAIKQAIYDKGPVAAAVYATSAMQSYTGGIFNSCVSGSVNHAVCIVGWDDASSYWIVKNSWGTNWGESGYIRITYGCNQIGYAAAYAVPSGGTPPPDDPYEPNDSAAAAYGPLTSGQDYPDAEISTSTDADWFHFTIAETGSITVSVTHESGADLDWYLYHESDTTNYLARGYTTNNPETGSYSATLTGKYYVKVVGYNGSTSTFTLKVTYPTGGGGGGGEGVYRIVNRYSGYDLDTNSGSVYVYHFAYTGTNDKHWEIIDLGTGYYRIDNVALGTSLDVGTGNYVYNYVWNGGTDKQWIIYDLGNGYYSIDSRASGYSLDVNSGSSYVYHYIWNGGTDKQWQLIEL